MTYHSNTKAQQFGSWLSSNRGQRFVPSNGPNRVGSTSSFWNTGRSNIQHTTCVNLTTVLRHKSFKPTCFPCCHIYNCIIHRDIKNVRKTNRKMLSFSHRLSSLNGKSLNSQKLILSHSSGRIYPLKLKHKDSGSNGSRNRRSIHCN